MMKVVLNRAIIFLLLAFNAVLGGWLGFSVQDRDFPITVLSKEPQEDPIQPGQMLRIKYTLIRHRSCTTHSDRFVIDSEGTRFTLQDQDYSGIFPLGMGTITVPIEIPFRASSGPATYIAYSTFVCNVIQKMWPIGPMVKEVKFNIK